ncbi:MAG: hypothetical protein IKK38_05750 [Spirochaetaceae bacterium]|nr:hypothetical protein [Spirochaetaceae bacterium]
MLGVYIAVAVIVLVLVGTIYGMYERKYLVDLLDDADVGLLKLRRLGIEKLELKRYAMTYYAAIGAAGNKYKRRMIPLNSYDQNSSSLLCNVEDELEVSGSKGSMSHTIFVCPYSSENKARLLELIGSFNNVMPN